MCMYVLQLRYYVFMSKDLTDELSNSGCLINLSLTSKREPFTQHLPKAPPTFILNIKRNHSQWNAGELERRRKK